MTNYHLTVTIWEEEGVYVSKCVELDVASCGDTPKEARENIREAIDLYFEKCGGIRDVNRYRTFTHNA